MGYLLEESFRIFLSYLTASCLAYIQLDILGKRQGQVNTRPHKACAKDFSLWLQLPERHVKVNRGTLKLLASRAHDDRGIKSGSLDFDTTHAGKGSYNLDVPFSANLVVFQFMLPFVAVF